MSKYDRISTEELAQEALLAERKRIENAVYRSKVAMTDAIDALDPDSLASVESLSELLDEHKGQLQRLAAHINRHGAQIFEDAYWDRRLREAREERA